MTRNECYRNLEIEPTLDKKIVKAAFRRLAHDYHPDKNRLEEASEKFQLIHDAYENLMLYIDFREQHGEAIGQMLMDDEQQREADLQERVRKAREAKLKKREDEKALIHRIYHKYTHSWRIYLSGVLLLVALPLAFAVGYDFVCQGTHEYELVLNKKIAGAIDDVRYADFYISIRGQELAVSPDFFELCKEQQPIIIERGAVLGTIKNITVGQGYSTITEEPRLFYNDAWVVLILLLVFPLVGFFFMRPHFTYVFLFVQYSLYIHPLIIVYVLLGSARIVYLYNALFG